MSSTQVSPKILHLGLRSFSEIWQLQKEVRQKLLDGESEEHIFFCEHPPVITLGKSSKLEDLLISESDLQKKGIDLQKIDRGGSVTFHGPGQLIVYPVLNLKNYKADVHWYMRILEEFVIQTLSSFQIEGLRIPGKTGVWTHLGYHDTQGVLLEKARKIASLGVHISRWVSIHGVSLNVLKAQDGFAFMNPCGLGDIEIDSMEAAMERSGQLVGDGVLSVEEVSKRGAVILTRLLDQHRQRTDMAGFE